MDNSVGIFMFKPFHVEPSWNLYCALHSVHTQNILSCNNILYYSFYGLFELINAALVCIKCFFKNMKLKSLIGSVLLLLEI